MTGEEFREIRNQLGLSQTELAEVLCLASKQVVSNIENGLRNPSVLSATLMRVLLDLPERRSKELQKMLVEFRDPKAGTKKRKSK